MSAREAKLLAALKTVRTLLLKGYWKLAVIKIDSVLRDDEQNEQGAQRVQS